MTVPVDEKYDGDVGPEDFVTADDPPEAPDEGAESAPYGWARDKDTGELRPRKRPGRPPKQPTPDTTADAPPISRAEDKPPGPSAGRGRGRSAPSDAPSMPRGGVIAAGVNKLYKRAGKIYRAFDYDIGTALIAITEPDEPDEMSVGQAWENLCKGNPRVRAVVLKAITTGDIGELIAVHLPVAIAFVMKPWIQRLIPVGRLVESMAEPDEDTPEGEGGLPGGMTADDFGQMRDLAQEQARRMAERMGMTVTDEQMAEATAAASARFADGVPPAFRAQPRRTNRAARRRG